MTKSAYILKTPEIRRSCVVFNSPHSGSNYPTDLLTSTRLDHVAIRSSEDAFVDELYQSAPDVGATLLCATAPRAYVDLNRAADELDPAMIEGVKSRGMNACIAAGLGVIPRVVAHGQAIRSGKISTEMAADRLDRIYRPYHMKLSEILADVQADFGLAVLIDCHSMPHAALRTAPLVGGRSPDVVLGDRFGTSCDRWIIDSIERIFTTSGLTVARNMPFAGGYITQHYGRPKRGVHAVQIEIDRQLYMDEPHVLKSENFVNLQELMKSVTRQIAEIGPAVEALAAE